MRWFDVYRYIEPGDIIQYYNSSKSIYHSQIVHRTSYENDEFKVSVGQHSSNEWRNLRTTIYNAYIQNSSTIICVIKIIKPAAPALSNSTKTISELTEMDDYYYNQLPNTLNTLTEENEKWAQISSIKDEMIARAKSGIIAPHQYQVSKSLLIEFIEGQIDTNNQIINASSNISDSKEVKKVFN